MHEKDVNTEDSKKQTANASLRAAIEQRNLFAVEAVNAATIGKACVADIINYLGPLVELADPSPVTDEGLRYRLRTVSNLASMALRFAEEMEALMEQTKDERSLALAAARGGAQ